MSGKHNSNDLAQGLKQRHVTMLSIAGVIGAGLFVGSGHAIAAAGPAVLLAYAAAGTLVVLVMRMLGEMAIASPDTGSFSTYADRSIGRWAGFTIGWLYWWFWVPVIPLEANAAAAILHAWFPAVDLWAFSLIITLALTLTNLCSVKNYGEFEFWFALLKVLAIIGFIVVGCVAMFGLVPNSQVSGVSHLFDTQGFMPNGLGAVLAAMLTTMFSFMGTEIVTIAAAESKDPGKQISRATNSVIWRICLFYRCRSSGRGPGAMERPSPGRDRFLPDRPEPHRRAECQVDRRHRRADRRDQLPELGAVHLFAHAVLPEQARRCAGHGAAHHQGGDSALGGPAVHSGGVSVRVRQLRGSGCGVRIPAGQLRRHRAAGVPVIAVSQLRMRSQREARGEKIAFKMWLFPG